MTTVHQILRKCVHCGTVNSYDVVGSTITFDMPDLDTRPAPLKRDTIKFGIERCKNCNYSSNNIEEKIEFDENILESDNYKKVLNSNYPELAKSYILASMIKESIDDYVNAAIFMLNACWVLDDNKIDAKKSRLIAAKLFEKIDGEEVTRLIIIDLYRRAEEFDKAREIIKKSYGLIKDDFNKKVLKCEEVLVDIYDSECHPCSEIDKFIGESGIEEEKADSMEEVERKLFSENSKENIRLYSNKGVLATFEQVALIPLELNGEKNIYAILHPIDSIVEDDEALVFQLIGEEHLDELSLISDDDIIDKVFNEYYRLVEENNS